MTERAPDRFWSGIDIPKTIAGTLAAVSAAVVGSFLGVAGTLIGAAVASIVGSVGTELYHRWIDRGSRRIKSTFVTAPAAVGTPEVAAAVADVPSQPEPGAPIRVRWGRLAAVAGVFFLLAMGSLTAFELAAGKSVADTVGNRTGSSTTIGGALRGDDDRKPAPATSESAAPEESARPGDEPTAPASTPPSEHSEPTAEPTETAAPTEIPPTPAQGETGQAPQDGGDQTQPQDQQQQQQQLDDGSQTGE